MLIHGILRMLKAIELLENNTKLNIKKMKN